MILQLLLMINEFTLSGHHETPPEAHTKMLEKFPDSFPRNQGNVIPPTTDKKVEEVCVCVCLSHDLFDYILQVHSSICAYFLTLPSLT